MKRLLLSFLLISSICAAQKLPVDTAVVVTVGPLVDETDGATLEEAIAYNAAGMTVTLIESSGTASTGTAITLTSAGANDWTHKGDGVYEIELTAAQVNTGGDLSVVGKCDATLPFFSPVYEVVPANVFNSLILGTDTIESDLIQVNSATTPVTAFEAQYDGTGISGDNYPSTQAQVGNIAIAGASINTTATAYTLTTGTQSANLYTDTASLNGTRHTHTDTAGVLELYYEFNVGNNGIPVGAKMTGALTGNNDDLGVYAYNWAGTSWDQVGEINGTVSSTNAVHTYDLFTSHVGIGSDIGLVRIRFYAASGLTTATLYVDQILCEYSQSVSGIANGSTVTLTSATENSNLIGRGWILALGGQSISGSYFFQAKSVTGTATSTNGSQPIFQESGFGTASLSADAFIENCALGGTITLTSTGGGTADEINFFDCQSSVAGSGAPTIDASGATKTTSVSVRKYSGGLIFSGNGFVTASLEVLDGGTQTITTGGGDVELRGLTRAINLTTSGASTTQLVGVFGPITINGTGGTVNIYGLHNSLTDNSTGTTINDFGQDTNDQKFVLADTDELQGDWVDGGRLDLLLDALPLLAEFATVDTGQTTGVDGSVVQIAASDMLEEPANNHTTPGSIGKAFKSLSEIIISSGTAQSAANDYSIVLDGSEPVTSGLYDPSRIVIVGGTGIKQSRLIYEYSIDNASRLAIVDRDWKVRPDNTSEYIILADAGRETVNEGLARGGTSNTITLNALAPTGTNTILHQLIMVRAGVGADQTAIVVGYNGTSKVAEVFPPWPLAVPTTASVYNVQPSGPSSLIDGGITSGTYDESTAFPITSADSGITQIARTGADADTLETLSDEIAVVDGNVDSILTDTGTTIPAQITSVHGTTDALIAALNDYAAGDDWDALMASYNDANTFGANLQNPVVAGGDATLANQVAMTALLDAIQGSGFVEANDSLAAIRARGDIAWVTGGAGAGAITFTYTLLNETTSAPIDDALCEMFTEVAMTNRVASLRTDAFGVAVFTLDAGTYHMKRSKGGWQFENPTTQVVN